MSPVDAAAAAFGYIQNHRMQPEQHPEANNYDKNICTNKAEDSIQECTSATVILLTKFASFLGSVIHEFGFGETLVQPISDIQATARIISEILTSLIASPSKSTLSTAAEDSSFESSSYKLSQHQSPLPTGPSQSGSVALLSSELLFEDIDSERLDYSISQLDVLRMSRAASRRLRVESIDHLPTTIYHEEQDEAATCHKDLKQATTNCEEEQAKTCVCDEEENELICSSHEEFEEEVHRRAREHVVDKTYPSVKHTLEQGDSPEFSWLMVPEDPQKDDLTRFSHQQEQLSGVPESVSICSSRHSENEDLNHCVICQEPFHEGENLTVLPCDHLFHFGCIFDKMITEKHLEEDIGCPKCKEQEEMGESHESDGSVPSWSFKRLGSLLANMSK